jgi:hypothetical protein
MAVSDNTKKKRNSALALYKAGNAVSDALINLSSIKDFTPYYENSYADELKSIYQKIKDAPEFEYSSDNDAAYRSFADEYRALAALAVAGNQAQAQGMTGGYGASYADAAASQNLQSLNESAENAKPAFLENAQEAYAANNDLLKQMFQAASGARDSELEDFTQSASAYNNALKAAQTAYADTRDFDYSKYSENRDFWDKQYENELDNENKQKQLELKKYDVYKQLAADKCSEFNEKKNNKGMKNYLDNLVKEGKLTSYLANQLYQKYRYTASSSGRRSRSSGRSGSGGRSSTTQGKFDPNSGWVPDEKILQFVNLNNRAGSFNTAVYWIERLIKEKKLDKNEKLNYVYYFRKMLG